MKFIDIENNNGLKKFKLLFGLIYIKTVAAGCAGTVRLFGISVIKFYIRKNKIVYYFSLDFKLPIFCINAEKRQAQILKKWIDKKYHYAYDSIYCFFGSPSGELYIVLMILNELLKNNKSNKPIIIVNQKFKYDLCKLKGVN